MYYPAQLCWITCNGVLLQLPQAPESLQWQPTTWSSYSNNHQEEPPVPAVSKFWLQRTNVQFPKGFRMARAIWPTEKATDSISQTSGPNLSLHNPTILNILLVFDAFDNSNNHCMSLKVCKSLHALKQVHLLKTNYTAISTFVFIVSLLMCSSDTAMHIWVQTQNNATWLQ